MKNLILSAFVIAATTVSCGTVQSIVQNTVPYTTNVLVSSGVPGNQEISVTSSATSFAQYVGQELAWFKILEFLALKQLLPT